MIDGAAQARRTGRIDPVAFAATIDLLRRQAGLVFHDTRQPAVEAAVQRAMTQAGISDPAAFVTLLSADAPTFDDLVAEVTIGETYFFRESAHFDLIRAEIIPRLVAARPGRRVRAWSAACATGEEAYSLAITLLEQQVGGDVLGTDISRPRLRAARDAMYRRWSLRGVPDSTVARWFRRDDDRYVLADSARQHTTFGYLNLAADAYPALSTGVWGMDLILCRNVLIYFDAPTIERVSRSLLDSLSDDGWLLLGAADPALTSSMGAEVIETPAGLAYRRLQRTTRRATPPPVLVETAPFDSTVGPSYDFVSDAMPETTDGGTTPALSEVIEAEADLVLAAYVERDYDTVVALVNAHSASAGTSIAHQVLLVRALANLGRLSDAILACASALDAQRDVAELHYLHSVLLMESGRPADAALAAKRAVYLDRGLIVAQLAAATAASRSGDPASASRSLAAAERLLASLSPEAVVTASDGETAGRLLEMTRVQRRLLAP